MNNLQVDPTSASPPEHNSNPAHLQLPQDPTTFPISPLNDTTFGTRTNPQDQAEQENEHDYASHPSSNSHHYPHHHSYPYDVGSTLLDTLAAAADANASAAGLASSGLSGTGLESHSGEGEYIPYGLDNDLGMANVLGSMGMSFTTHQTPHQVQSRVNEGAGMRHGNMMPYHFNHNHNHNRMPSGNSSQGYGHPHQGLNEHEHEHEREDVDEHGNPAPGGANARLQDDKQRKRIMQACEACRVRKAKCNGLQPCGRCSTRKLTCSYAHERKMRGPNKVRKTLEMKQRDREHRQAKSTTMQAEASSAMLDEHSVDLMMDPRAHSHPHPHSHGHPRGGEGELTLDEATRLEHGSDKRNQDYRRAPPGYTTDLARDSYDRAVAGEREEGAHSSSNSNVDYPAHSAHPHAHSASYGSNQSTSFNSYAGVKDDYYPSFSRETAEHSQSHPHSHTHSLSHDSHPGTPTSPSSRSHKTNSSLALAQTSSARFDSGIGGIGIGMTPGHVLAREGAERESPGVATLAAYLLPKEDVSTGNAAESEVFSPGGGEEGSASW